MGLVGLQSARWLGSAPSGDSWGDCIPGLSQFLEVACIPWLGVPSFISKAGSAASSKRRKGRLPEGEQIFQSSDT